MIGAAEPIVLDQLRSNWFVFNILTFNPFVMKILQGTFAKVECFQDFRRIRGRGEWVYQLVIRPKKERSFFSPLAPARQRARNVSLPQP